MREIAPGVFHWKAHHPKIDMEVSSYYLPHAGVAIDPLLPAGGLAPLEDREVWQIVLTNRHHLRSAEKIAEHFNCPIRCHEAGLHEFKKRQGVEGFEWGDELAPRVTALEVDAICDEETALRIDLGDGFLAVADAVMRYRPELHFVPSQYLGDDVPAVKRAIRAAYRDLLDEPFESLLFAHGDPLLGEGKEALRKFAQEE